jgi:choline-glycine betaine transporter
MVAILITFNYLMDIGGVKNLAWSTEIVPVPLLVILILMLLSEPWFIKYQNNQRYKKLFSNLRESAHQLNDQLGF